MSPWVDNRFQTEGNLLRIETCYFRKQNKTQLLNPTEIHHFSLLTHDTYTGLPDFLIVHRDAAVILINT